MAQDGEITACETTPAQRRVYDLLAARHRAGFRGAETNPENRTPGVKVKSPRDGKEKQTDEQKEKMAALMPRRRRRSRWRR